MTLPKGKPPEKRLMGSTLFVSTENIARTDCTDPRCGEQHPKDFTLLQQSLVGRRQWNAFRDSERWRLTNIANQTTEYWPRGVYEADCVKWQSHSDRGPSPHPSCTCGLYAFWDMAEQRDQYHMGCVTGIIEAWGRIRPGAQGFLAQYMTPVALDLPTCQQGWAGGAYSGGRRGAGCDRPAELGQVSNITWLGDYPSQWDDPTGYEDAHEWVDLRGSVGWRCVDHMNDWGDDRVSSKAAIFVTAAEMYYDLQRYYEVDLLPAAEWSEEAERMD